MSTHKKPAPQIYDGVSTSDVPSAGFGWSRTPFIGTQVAGWVSVFVLLMYNFGNHRGHVETIWLLVLAAVIALGLVLHMLQPKLNQVRTVTARNQPVGHVEMDYMYNQATVSGRYAELTDGQLRALNIDPARVAHLRTNQDAISQ